jgi:aspartate aminotransferase
VSALFGRTWKGRPLRTSADVAGFLLEEARIAVVPGSGFGSDDHIRLSYATSMEKIKEGMDRMGKAINTLG